jgi:hypothetical protein
MRQAVPMGGKSPRKRWAERHTNTFYVCYSRHLNPVRKHSFGWQHHGGEAVATPGRKVEAPNRREVNVRVGA